MPRSELTHLSPAEAQQAIELLRLVEERLHEGDGAALARCLGFAKDALWAAAYPDDPYSMLATVEQQASIAMG